MRKELGKITDVYVGFGGYQEACIGISFTFSFDGCGVGDFKGNWSNEPSENAKWTKQEQKESLGETMLFIAKLLSDANVNKVEKLKGKPVEITFEGNCLKSWRLLTEVI